MATEALFQYLVTLARHSVIRPYFSLRVPAKREPRTGKNMPKAW